MRGKRRKVAFESSQVERATIDCDKWLTVKIQQDTNKQLSKIEMDGTELVFRGRREL